MELAPHPILPGCRRPIPLEVTKQVMKLNALQIELSLLLLCAATPCARPQGTFVNLDFESANIIPDTNSFLYPIAVAVSNALPGWTAYGGVVYPYDVVYDTIAL